VNNEPSPDPRTPAGTVGLLEKLMGTVRAEFRDDVLVFDAEDPIFGAGLCRISGCARSARGGQGMCQGHHQRWAQAGRPDLGGFIASTDPRWRRDRPNMVCAVFGCGYGSSRRGMCVLHAQRWERAGRPDRAVWLVAPLPVKQPAPGATCAIEHCDLWPHAASVFCHAHHATWQRNGGPDVTQFADEFVTAAAPADQVVRLDGLGPQLRLEVAYALQCRRDERGTTCPPAVVMQVVRFLVEADEMSLLVRTEQQWATSIGRPAPTDSNPRALLVYARRQVEDLTRRGGWEDEYDHDIWHLRRLGFDGNPTLSFDAIPQPWLRELVKRWVRWRLSTGLVLETVRRGLRSLTRFAVFCDRAGVEELAEVDRDLLERYLPDLAAELAGRQRHGDQIGQLSAFLHAIRVHRWEPSLPATAMLFSEDYPERAERPPRALPEQVMAQLGQTDNLDRWNNDAHRLVTLILIRCGLRVNDALRLPRECVVLDADQAPYLRYFNHKMETRGPGPHRRRTPRPDHRAHPDARVHAGAVSAGHQEPRRQGADEQFDLPDRALPLAGALRGPRRARPPRPADSAPVEAHARDEIDQQRRASGGRPPHPRSRLGTDDVALRPPARHHRPATLGGRPKGRHHRLRSDPRPRRASS
jgi:hypothetical protein